MGFTRMKKANLVTVDNVQLIVGTDNSLTMENIRRGVVTLIVNDIPTDEGGDYHLQMSETARDSLFKDVEFFNLACRHRWEDPHNLPIKFGETLNKFLPLSLMEAIIHPSKSIIDSSIQYWTLSGVGPQCQ